MRFVDAHIHLSDPEYSGKTQELIDNAKQANVAAIISNSMNLETSRGSLKLAEQHTGLVYAAFGIHPWNVSQLRPSELEQTIDLILQNGTDRNKVVAIGEVGLDPQYAKRKQQRELQVKVFHEMLRLAEKLALPIIVHSRWSAQKIIDILPSYGLDGVLWHWYSGPVDTLPKIVERGDYASEGPPAVFSPRIQDVVKLLPLQNLLTETDGPVRFYGPFKDRSTTPAFIPEVVKALAEIKSVSEVDVADHVLSNFSRLFGIEF